MDILDKIDMIVENDRNDRLRAKEFIEKMIKKYGKDSNRIHKSILDNVVNSKYGKESNSYIEVLWKEFGKIFPS